MSKTPKCTPPRLTHEWRFYTGFNADFTAQETIRECVHCEHTERTANHGAAPPPMRAPAA